MLRSSKSPRAVMTAVALATLAGPALAGCGAAEPPDGPTATHAARGTATARPRGAFAFPTSSFGRALAAPAPEGGAYIVRGVWVGPEERLAVLRLDGDGRARWEQLYDTTAAVAAAVAGSGRLVVTTLDGVLVLREGDGAVDLAARVAFPRAAEVYDLRAAPLGDHLLVAGHTRVRGRPALVFARIDGEGTLVEAVTRTLDAGSSAFVEDLALTPADDGGVAVTGRANGPFVAKFDGRGALLWASALDAPSVRYTTTTSARGGGVWLAGTGTDETLVATRITRDGRIAATVAAAHRRAWEAPVAAFEDDAGEVTLLTPAARSWSAAVSFRNKPEDRTFGLADGLLPVGLGRGERGRPLLVGVTPVRGAEPAQLLALPEAVLDSAAASFLRDRGAATPATLRVRAEVARWGSERAPLPEVERLEVALLGGEIPVATPVPSGTPGFSPVFGTSRGDTLRGDDGPNWLQGYAGDDDLSGGRGDDVYLFGRTLGVSHVYEDGGVDTVRFLYHRRDEVTVTREGDDIDLTFRRGERVVLRDFFTREAYRVERVEFAEGPALTAADLALVGEDRVDLVALNPSFSDRFASLTPAFDPGWTSYTATMDLNKRCDMALAPEAREADAVVEIRHRGVVYPAGAWMRFGERESNPVEVTVRRGALAKTYSIAIRCYPVAP